MLQRIVRQIQVNGLTEYLDQVNNLYYKDIINAYASGGVFYSIASGLASAVRTNLLTGAETRLTFVATAPNQIVSWAESVVLPSPTPEGIRDALVNLPPGSKLPGSAIEGGVASSETGQSLRDKLEALGPGDRLDATAIENLPTNEPNTYIISYYPAHNFVVTNGMASYTVPEAARKGTIHYIVVDGEVIDNDGVQYTYDTATGVVNFGTAFVVPSPPTTYTAAIHWLPVSGDPGSATVREQDGVPTVSGVNTWEFSGATVLDLGNGAVRVTLSGGTTNLVVREQDGTPSISTVDTVEFATADFIVTDLGNGDVRVSRRSDELAATYALKTTPILNLAADATTERTHFEVVLAAGELATGKVVDIEHVSGLYGGTGTNTNSVVVKGYLNNNLVYTSESRSITGASGEREWNETIRLRALSDTTQFIKVDTVLGDGQTQEVRMGGNQPGGGSASASVGVNGATGPVTFKLTTTLTSLNDGYVKLYGYGARRVR